MAKILFTLSFVEMRQELGNKFVYPSINSG